MKPGPDADRSIVNIFKLVNVILSYVRKKRSKKYVPSLLPDNHKYNSVDGYSSEDFSLLPKNHKHNSVGDFSNGFCSFLTENHKYNSVDDFSNGASLN